MNARTRAYVYGVYVLALIIISAQDWRVFGEFSLNDLGGLFAVVAIGCLSDIMSFRIQVGKGSAFSSIGFLSLFAAAMIFPMPAVILGAVAAQIVSEIATHPRREYWKIGFNVSQVALSLFLALTASAAFEKTSSISDLSTFLAFITLSFTFFFSNHLLVSIALTLHYGGKFKAVFSQVLGRSGSNILFDVLVSPISLILYLLYNQWGPTSLLIVILPLWLIRHSYGINRELIQANRDLLKVLVKAIETRDPYTSGHSVRVSVLARKIAEDLNLPPRKVDDVETAALVHDIGKVDLIYAELIRKQAALSDDERRVIVTHAAKGAEFLRTLTSVKEDIVAGVRHHHERFDGTGYPDRLAGEAIPLIARIIMVCDSVDAMLSDRPYRKALSIDQVRSELVRCSGSQFDPRIVQSILRHNSLEHAVQLIPAANLQVQIPKAV